MRDLGLGGRVPSIIIVIFAPRRNISNDKHDNVRNSLLSAVVNHENARDLYYVMNIKSRLGHIDDLQKHLKSDYVNQYEEITVR